MTLVHLSLAWVVGILVGQQVGTAGVAFAAGGLLLVALWSLLRRHPSLVAMLCLAVLAGGVLRYHSSLPPPGERQLRSLSEEIEFTGVVTTSPLLGDRFTTLRVESRQMRTEGVGWQPVSGEAAIWVPRSAAYAYGDILLIRGRFEKYSSNRPVIDTGIYRERSWSTPLLAFPETKLIGRGNVSLVLTWLHSLRERLSLSLKRALPEPQASLAQAILLGQRADIPHDVRSDFIRSGTTHVLVISGQNMSLVAGMMVAAGAWLLGRRRYLHVWFALVAVWIYTMLVGADPPVVRAAIMATAFLIAEFSGRQRNAVVAVALAAAIMVGVKPVILWDISFQLSFLATLGLVLIAPPLRALGLAWVERLGAGREGLSSALVLLVEATAVSLAAMIATWPLISHAFGRFSIVGLPATMMMLPVLPGIIVASMATGLLGLLSPAMGTIAGWFNWPLLTYLDVVAHSFSLLPMASVDLRLGGSSLAAYYVLLLSTWLVVMEWQRRASRRVDDAMEQQLERGHRHFPGWSFPVLILVVAIGWGIAQGGPRATVRVSFLDVGQGQAVLVQTAGTDVLIDGGPDSRALNTELGRLLPFWDRRIDLVVSTQPHADHLTGLVGLADRYVVGRILDPGVAHDSQLYAEWLRKLDEKRIRRDRVHAGHEFEVAPGVKMQVLNPPSEARKNKAGLVDVDSNGVVVRLVVDEVSFLLMADVGEETERDLVHRRATLPSTVLAVGHHGSRTSTSSGLLAVVQPRVAVISVGTDNRFGHPHPETLARLRASLKQDSIYLTGGPGGLYGRGTIEFTTDGRRLWVKTER